MNVYNSINMSSICPPLLYALKVSCMPGELWSLWDSFISPVLLVIYGLFLPLASVYYVILARYRGTDTLLV